MKKSEKVNEKAKVEQERTKSIAKAAPYAAYKKKKKNSICYT